MIKYCDKCKWDDSGSWTNQQENEDGELETCPICGQKLWEVESYEDIP